MRPAQVLLVLCGVSSIQAASWTACSLNGKLNASGVCACNAPWTGLNCSTLARAPAVPGAAYGVQPNASTWGGNVLHGDDGLYHLFVAEMVNNCSLADWQTNSQCTHAVATSPEGPFEKRDVAVPVWCHNPEVHEFTIGGTKFFALFHIGDGVGNPKHCNATSPEQTTVAVAPHLSSVESTLHTSTSLNGPWTPVPGFPSCNNPTAMQHPNGTIFALCDSTTLLRSEQITGPWITVKQLAFTGGPDCGLEDAFLWIDPQGAWHSLFHCWSNVPPPSGSCVGTNVSAHAFSRDGLDWAIWPTQPFDGHVAMTDGTSLTLSTRERPKLFFDASGVPTHLYSGVCPHSFCAGWWCSHCKALGWWTFTLAQPLGGA